MDEISTDKSEAESCAIVAMYKFRELIQGFHPEKKLFAAKALLRFVRTMVEDLEQSI